MSRNMEHKQLAAAVGELLACKRVTRTVYMSCGSKDGQLSNTEQVVTRRRRLSVTNYSSENYLPTFRLNAPVVIRAKVKEVRTKHYYL